MEILTLKQKGNIYILKVDKDKKKKIRILSLNLNWLLTRRYKHDLTTFFYKLLNCVLFLTR